MSTHPAANQQRSDARRNFDKIVAAAEELFSRKGIDVPFRLVAQHAGVGHGTLYRHFPSKHALAIEIYTRRLNRYEQVIAGHEAPAELLRDLLRTVAEDQRAIPALFRLIERGDAGSLGASLADTPSISSLPVKLLRQRTEGIFGTALQRTQAAGVAIHLDTEDVLIMLAMLLGAANSPSARRDHVDAIRRGLAIIEAALN